MGAGWGYQENVLKITQTEIDLQGFVVIFEKN
jgi:hypothetical protein